MHRRWLISVTMLLSFGASTSPDTNLGQLTNELLIASGAEVVDCGIGAVVVSGIEHIGCGKVAGSLKDFERRAHAELIKRGWKTTNHWYDSGLTCTPPPAGKGPYQPTAEKDPYILSFNINCPAGDPPTTVFLTWSKATPLEEPTHLCCGIHPPEQTHFVKPEYPGKARKKGIEGKVILEIVVGKTGNVEDVKVLESFPVFDQAAIDSVRQWKYRPAMRNGTPVSVYRTVIVEFNLH